MKASEAYEISTRPDEPIDFEAVQEAVEYALEEIKIAALARKKEIVLCHDLWGADSNNPNHNLSIKAMVNRIRNLGYTVDAINTTTHASRWRVSWGSAKPKKGRSK